MKLECAEVMHALFNNSIFVSFDADRVYSANVKDQVRQELMKDVIPRIHQSQKFIFDSELDADPQTKEAIRETANNMIEAGIFHLPHNLIWLEEQFITHEKVKTFYLCEEVGDKIRIQTFSLIRKNVCFLAQTAIINLDKNAIHKSYDVELFDDKSQPSVKDLWAAVYAVKKLVVFLNSRGTEEEKIRVPGHRNIGNFKNRLYPHSIVRIPSEIQEPSTATGTGKRRRLHLVRGFTRTYQNGNKIWIDPFWRGSKELGEVVRDHYEIGTA